MVTALLLLTAMIAGCYLLVRGIRGNRVGDHPHCRACEFDLFGLPADQGRCPECGAPLSSAAAIVGQRVRRPRMALIGAMLILPGALYLANIIAMLASSGADLLPYKPVWLLAFDVTHPAEVVRHPTLKEISSRITAGKLSQGQFAGIADRVLGVQEDPQAPWDPEWGNLMTEAQAAGLLSAEQRLRFGAASMPEMTFAVRRRVRLGDPLPFQIVESGSRAGNRLSLWLYTGDGEAEIGGKTVPLRDGFGHSTTHVGGSMALGRIPAETCPKGSPQG